MGNVLSGDRHYLSVLCQFIKFTNHFSENISGFLTMSMLLRFLDFSSPAKHRDEKKNWGDFCDFHCWNNTRRLRTSSKSGFLSEEKEMFLRDFERSNGIYPINSYKWMRVKPVCGTQGVKSHMRDQYDIIFYFPSSQKYLRRRGRPFRIFWEFFLKALIPSHKL